MTQPQHQQGFTLIEIAIVLLIVSFMIGGLFQGQQLLQNAKTQHLSTDIGALRAAWYSFLDRYHALPGDFAGASAQIDTNASDGDGNAQVNSKAEVAALWQHLSLSGFISGQFDANSDAIGTLESVDCQSSTCPKNPYNGHYKVLWSNRGKNQTNPRHLLYTGGSIPASALYQLDMDLDDGLPGSGSIRVHADFDNEQCLSNNQWNGANQESQCAAVVFLN